MSVRTYVRARDGATVYVACFYGPEGRRIVRKYKTVKASGTQKDHERARVATLKYAQDQRVDVENGNWTEPKSEKPTALTVHGLIRRFLRSYTTRSGEIRYYQDRAKTFERLLPNKLADKLTAFDVEDFRRACETEGVGPSTVGKNLIALGTIYRWALSRHLVKSNPADPSLVRRPRRPHPDPQPYSEADLAALLDELPASFGAVVTFLEQTGADVSEALTLSWTRHVHRESRVIRLPRTKTGVDRSLPYAKNTTLRLLLDTAWKARHASGTVFLHEGEPIPWRTAQSAMTRALRRAGIEKSRPWKSLRATFATRKAMEKVPVSSIAAMMGLTTAHVLEHYIRPLGLHLEEAMSDGTENRTENSGQV